MQVAVRDLTVMLDHGLHARPAARFVQLANRFQSEITVQAGARSASAKGIIGVIGLGVRQGATIHLKAVGPDAEEALESLIHLLTRNEGDEP